VSLQEYIISNNFFKISFPSLAVDYIFYTFQKFLLAIPNGLLGKQIEKKFLKVVKIQGVAERKKIVKK